jgi:hypothetical protein
MTSTNRFKDFGSGKTSGETEPLVFKLHDEEFVCVPEIQGQVMLDLVVESNSDNPSATAKVIGGFFQSVLEEESYARFDKLREDKTRIVSVETLSEIVAWLIESYSNRPNQQPEA